MHLQVFFVLSGLYCRHQHDARPFALKKDQVMMLLMEEILHHLGCIKPRKITVDFNYLPFPQLVDPRRISSRCSSTRTNPTNRRAAASPRIITAVLCAGVSLSFALRIASKAGWPVACGLGRRWLTACAKKINGWNPKIMEVDGR